MGKRVKEGSFSLISDLVDTVITSFHLDQPRFTQFLRVSDLLVLLEGTELFIVIHIEFFVTGLGDLGLLGFEKPLSLYVDLEGLLVSLLAHHASEFESISIELFFNHY
jgi:hypothetical protein